MTNRPGIKAAVLTAALLASLCAARAAEDAKAVLGAAGVKAGLCVHLGAGDGRMEVALAENPKLLVEGLASEVAAARAARDFIRSKGLYGRASVGLLRPGGLPYSAELVNVLIAEKPSGVGLGEMLRVLAPGGALALGGVAEAGLRAELARLGLAGPEIRRAGGLLVLLKPRPAGMAEWTHPNCDAGGGRVSPDAMKPPNRLRWTAGLSYARTGDTASGYEALRSAGGRNFYLLNAEQVLLPKGEAARQVLVARDAFNGLPLWRRAANEVGPSTFVAAGGRVFVTDAAGVVALGATDGKPLTSYGGFGCGGAPKQILVHRDTLLTVWSQGLRAIDIKTGRLKWKHDLAKDAFFTENYFYKIFNSVYAEGDGVFFATSNARYWWGGPGNGPAAGTRVELHALNFADGQPRWKTDISERMRRNATKIHEMRANKFLFAKDGLLVFEFAGKNRTSIAVCAFSAKDGRFLWEYSTDCARVLGYTAPPATLCAGGHVWLSIPWAEKGRRASMNHNEMLGLDPGTGKVSRRFRMNEVLGCWRDLATERCFVAGRPPDFIDWADGKVNPFDGVRNSCKVGAIVANGMYYTVPNKCRCINDQIRGFVGFGREAPGEPEHPLEKGPAFGAVGREGAPGPGDWPTFRAEAARSCRAASAVPPAVKPLWSVAVAAQKKPDALLQYDRDVAPMGGDALTGPVVAGGVVYVGDVDSHRVVALDAESGAARWSYTAGGRLDAPPTIHGGLCLFGSRDGWAYCLRASDGKPVWRRRAAPEERRVAAFGQVESLWPVYGGVLVESGKACFAAGRSSASGGVYILAVKPASGEVLWKSIIKAERPPNQPKKLKVPTECCGDALVSDGKTVVLGSNILWRIDLETGKHQVGHPSKPRPQMLHARRGTFLLDRSWHWFDWGTFISGELRYGNLDYGGQMLALGEGRAFFCGRTCYWPTRGNKGTLDTAIAAVDLKESTGRRRRDIKPLWQTTVKNPTQLQAMILAGEVLFAGGPADRLDPKEGVLWAVSAKDGTVLEKLKLASPPVAEGLAAAGGRLYVATADGKLTCYGKK